jgi:hypothetical protein
MFDQYYGDALAEWLADFDRIRSGDLTEIERECYTEPGMSPLAEWLVDYPAPERKYYRPWRDDEATWFQVWQTVSEGSPVSPPFATREELIDYLVLHGDFWDQERGTGGYSREQAIAFVNAGWVPSAMTIVHGGVVTSATEGIASAAVLAGGAK